jgi:hypothetical protein
MSNQVKERRRWTCEFCGQTVLIDVDGAHWLPPGFLKNCRLADHVIGPECIAFRDRQTAEELLGK